MGLIQCKACGTLYRYEKEGCCPRCGAYNRPPKREVVNADGTVQHMTDAAYEKRQQAHGKVCFEEKECHEKKVCYEDQARRGSAAKSAPKPTGSAPQSQFSQTQSAPVRSAPTERRKKGLPLGCLIPLLLMVYFLAKAVFSVLQEVLSSLGM